MLQFSGLSFVAHTCSQEVRIVELFAGIVVLTMPMLNPHHSDFRSNWGQAVTTKPSLFGNKGFSQGIHVRVVIIIRVGGVPVLGKTSRLGTLNDPPHSLDSRNVI